MSDGKDVPKSTSDEEEEEEDVTLEFWKWRFDWNPSLTFPLTFWTNPRVNMQQAKLFYL